MTFAKTLPELPAEKVRKCWFGLQKAPTNKLVRHEGACPMLARTATGDATFDPESVTVAAAYPALGLPQGARRSEIRSAYRRLVLKVHPDRRRQKHLLTGASDDGAAFRRLKAAYDCLVKYTQFDEELDELDEQIAAEERELAGLETKRLERELRENALADLKTQRARRQAEEAKEWFVDAEDEERRRHERADVETRWLQRASDDYVQYRQRWGHHTSYDEAHNYRTRLIRDDAQSHGPPVAVMLIWPNGTTELCVQAPDSRRGSPVWRSDNKTALIEARVGPYGAPLWMLVVQRYNNVSGEWRLEYHWLPHSAWPFNHAEAGKGMYKWAHWADAPAGRMSLLDSRAVGPSELRRIRGKAADGKKKVEADRAEREAEAQLLAEQRKDDSEVQQREAHRECMAQRRAQVAASIAQRKEAEAAAAREQQMAQARQLEYQDAAWQAWLRELADERAQRLAKLKESKEKQLDERIEEGLGKSDDVKEMKRKREEKELARSKAAHEKRQPAMPERRGPGKEVKPPTPRVPRATSQDVGTLGISELRSIVRDAGLSTDGCIEIFDLRERAREAQSLLYPEEAAVDPSIRGSGSTDQPPVAAQPAAAVRQQVTLHESSDDDDNDDDNDDDELVLTRRPSFVAATATEATEAAAKVKAGAEAGRARVLTPKRESGEQQGRVKREAPPPWPRDAYEEVEFNEDGEPPALKSEEEVEVEEVEVEAVKVEAAEVEAGAAAAQERPCKRSSSRDARPTEPYVSVGLRRAALGMRKASRPASGRRLEESPSGKAAAPVKLSGDSAAPTKLDKGTRLQILWEDDDPPTWYAGSVVGWGIRDGRLGHRMLYDDRQRQLEQLEDLQWRLLNAAGEPEAMNAPAVQREAEEEEEEEEVVIATPSEAQAGVARTRSKRREVKLQEEDVVDGLTRCPGCGLGVHMANGGCNVTTCLHASKHGGRYYYFCAHCKAECPEGESMCTSCPMRNDRETRVRVKARREREWNAFLSSNSAENPSEVC